jgi:prepilin-type N-terminal cleavage/methylation domain-containing protein
MSLKNVISKDVIRKEYKTPSCAEGIRNDYRRRFSRIVLGHKDGGVSAGFTLIELMVTVGIFLFMTALVVAKYGSFNDGTLLTSMAYDVALTLRDAQSYGLNVQGYTPSSAPQNFNNPYGIHFSSASGSNQMILFADSNTNKVYDGSTVDGLITTYTLTNGGLISSICVTNTPPIPSATCSSAVVATSLDITFKRPDPNAIITANSLSGTTYAYAEIQVENASKTSTRAIVVRETGEIAVKNQ